MKNLIITFLLAISIVGCSKVEATEVETTKTTETTTLVDMSQVISFEETEIGLILNFADGTGYYVDAPNETKYIYPILDVVETEMSTLVVKMPNGSLHRYLATDIPEETVSKVVFKTLDQDNYESYKVLTME